MVSPIVLELAYTLWLFVLIWNMNSKAYVYMHKCGMFYKYKKSRDGTNN